MKIEQTTIKDERFAVAEEAIVEAFYILLKEKPMDKITVAEIVRQAGIVRSTFYNHYETVPDMVSAIEDKLVERIFEMLEDFRPDNNREICYRFYLTLCTYIKDNILLSQQLKSPVGDSFISKIITMFHKYVTTLEFGATDMGVAYIIGGTLGILHKWASDDYRESAENIAEFLSEAIIRNSDKNKL